MARVRRRISTKKSAPFRRKKVLARRCPIDISLLRIRRIARAYGFRVVSVKAFSSVYQARAAYRLRTPTRRLLLKPFRGSPATLQGIIRTVTYLRRHGFHAMPRWYRTKSGKTFICDGGQIFYVTDWVKGNNLGVATEDMMELGTALAKMHRAGQNIGGKHKSRQTTDPEFLILQREHRIFRRRLKSIVKQPTAIGHWFRSNGDTCVQLGEETWAVLLGPDGKTAFQGDSATGVVHGDITRPNLLERHHRVWFIDWESCRDGHPLYEVVKTLANTTEFDVNRMQALIAGYERIRPFTAAERRLIAALFRLPREAWSVAKNAALRRKDTVLPMLKGSWQLRLQAIAWLDDWARG